MRTEHEVMIAAFRLIETIQTTAFGLFDSSIIDRYAKRLRESTSKKKFSKEETAYSDIPISPPFLYDYRCVKCRAFQSPSSCEWVEGKIAEDGWCALWLPEPEDRPLSWVGRFDDVPGILSRTKDRLLTRAD